MNHNTPAHISRPPQLHYNLPAQQQLKALHEIDPRTQTHQHISATYSGSSARSRSIEKYEEKEKEEEEDVKEEKGLLSKLTQFLKPRNSQYNSNVISVSNNDNSYSRRRSTTSSHSQVQQVTTAYTVWQRWCPVRPSTAACVTILLLSTTCSLCSASLCAPQSWWDAYKDKCIPCTVCEGDTIPLRPCQVDRDTVCGSIYDLKIDWVVLSKTEPNWKERRKFDGLDYGLDHHQLTAEQLQQLQEETDPLDWQTAALFLAVLACLLFFIVAACILVHHMRQWRRMERRLDQDVEELSTKLMAKLAEVQGLEGGTFFIGNAEALRLPPASAAAAAATLTTAASAFHHPQHIMLPEKSDKHHQMQQPSHHQHLMQRQDHHFFNVTASTLKSGNVYIEENSSKC